MFSSAETTTSKPEYSATSLTSGFPGCIRCSRSARWPTGAEGAITSVRPHVRQYGAAFLAATAPAVASPARRVLYTTRSGPDAHGAVGPSTCCSAGSWAEHGRQRPCRRCSPIIGHGCWSRYRRSLFEKPWIGAQEQRTGVQTGYVGNAMIENRNGLVVWT